jgi:hypothetical protein
VILQKNGFFFNNFFGIHICLALFLGCQANCIQKSPDYCHWVEIIEAVIKLLK